MVTAVLLSLAVAAGFEQSTFIDHGVKLKNRAFSVMLVAGILTAGVVAMAIASRRTSQNKKWLLFLAITVPITIATIYAAGTTIYLNHISTTKGPVHWHADFEIWKCGKNVDLINPRGLSNRVGTPVLHEHQDNRIHVEGVVLKTKDVSLSAFFQMIGGSLTEEELRVPTNGGIVSLPRDGSCHAQPAKLQAFVYKVLNPEETGNWQYAQEKVGNFANYVLSPYSQVPPGDCIIIELNAEKEKTDKVCATYEAAFQRGEISGR